jgi:hypothetical protein
MRIKIVGNRPAPESLRNLFSRVIRGHAPSILVQRREIAYWQERGWIRQGNTFSGSYQTPYASFEGGIVQKGARFIDFYLCNPSYEIRNHSHWSCFQFHGTEGSKTWYSVHMANRAKDVSSGIMTIERLITEAYEK